MSTGYVYIIIGGMIMIYTKMYDVSFLPDILLRVGIGVVIVAI